MLRLAEKAFWPGQLPFPVMHVDTGPQLPRGASSSATGASPSSAPGWSSPRVQDADRRRAGRRGDRAPGQPQPAADHDAARRDRGARLRRRLRRRPPRRGEGPGQGAGVSASATSSASGTRRTSAPSCGASTTAATARASTSGCSRSRNWTELDIWQYIADEDIELPSIYFAHQREVFRRDGMLLAVSAFVTVGDDEEVESASVPLPHRRRRDLHRRRRVDRRHHRRRSSPRSPPPASPSGAPPGPTTASPRPPWRTASGRGTSDGWSCCASPPPARSTTASRTLIGRLLYDSKAIFEDQLEAVERTSARAGRRVHQPGAAHRRPAGRARAGHHHRRRLPLLRHAQAQVHHRRHPGPHPVHAQHGHRRLDRRPGAGPGRRPQRRRSSSRGATRSSRRCCGIPHLVVCVNKMDLVDWSEERLRRDQGRVPRASPRSSTSPTSRSCRSRRCTATTSSTARRTCPGTRARRCCTTSKRCTSRRDRNLIDARFPVQYVHPAA